MSSSASASAYWRVAGMSYLKYSGLCADMVRAALKEPARTKAKTREVVFFRRAEWKNGQPQKQGELKLKYYTVLKLVTAAVLCRCSMVLMSWKGFSPELLCACCSRDRFLARRGASKGMITAAGTEAVVQQSCSLSLLPYADAEILRSYLVTDSPGHSSRCSAQHIASFVTTAMPNSSVRL